jgi:hypothetical protein
MPQAVQTYVAKGVLLEVQRILDDLIIAIQADFVKYKKQIPQTNIKSVFERVVMQVGTKFKRAQKERCRVCICLWMKRNRGME